MEDSSKPEPSQSSEQEKLKLYGSIIYKEAISLLEKYLPEALPKEPTRIFFDTQPVYLGKFRGEHFITAEKILISRNDVKQTEEYFEAMKKMLDQWAIQAKEFARLVEEDPAKAYDEDFRNQIFSKEDTPVPDLKSVGEDWDEPERLLGGREEYSTDTWRGIYTMVHELIHQKQAELNPQAFPDLSIPELEKIDPSSISEVELKKLLEQAHVAPNQAVEENSLFLPVIEGMAVTGSFLVMSKLLAETRKDNQVEVSKKIRQARNSGIRVLLSESQQKWSYELNYILGTELMRKLYKQFGLEDAPDSISQIDLQACQRIIKGSPQYQEILENPSLLPGLPREN